MLAGKTAWNGARQDTGWRDKTVAVMLMKQAGSSPDALGQALRSGPFELAMKLAIKERSLSLDRLAHRLAQHGLNISTSTLSNWQNGRSRPERPDSLRALRVLEQALDLPR